MGKNRSWSFYKCLSKNKGIEFQAQTCREWDWFRFWVEWSRCCDHAGFKVDFELVGLCFTVNIYDHRHWNYDEERWYEEGERERDWSKEDNYN